MSSTYIILNKNYKLIKGKKEENKTLQRQLENFSEDRFGCSFFKGTIF
jgi:hypothetical protein